MNDTLRRERREEKQGMIEKLIKRLQDKHDAFIGNQKDQITSAEAKGFKQGLAWAIESAKKEAQSEHDEWNLPNNFEQLPKKLQYKLSGKHTHAELVEGEKIVYEEQDVLDIIKYVSEGNF